MSRYEDRRLLSAAKRGDRRARERVLAGRQGLVRSLAARYRDLGLPLDDLVQEGSLGLLEAIDRFDDVRGADFDAYARFRVRRAMRSALTDKSRLIRLPKQIVERRRAIDRAQARLTARRGRQATVDELAAATGLSQAAVSEALGVAVSTVSLDNPVLPDGSNLESVIADETARNPESEAVEHEQASMLDAALADLPARQREIVSRHFGLGCTPEDISHVAEDLRLSQQRTRTIERDALYTLRERLEGAPQSSRDSLSRR
jgi:RNA polymerase primary sigma factor